MVEEARAALAKTSGVEQEDDEVLTVEQELEKRKNAADSNGKNLSGVWVFGFGCWNQGFCLFFEKDDSFRSCFCDVFTGDADKADHYNGLLTSYRESTAAAEAASVVGGANVTETVENKFDLM